MTVTQKLKDFSTRPDVRYAALLAFLCVMIWCAVYNRWSVKSWQTPIVYTSDLSRGDVLAQFANIKAAQDGHILPLLPTNVPELGAPFVANWDDFPMTEKSLYWMMGFCAKFMGIFASANFAAMLEDVLAAVSFFVACRLLNCQRIWAFAGGLIFAFARFGFAHEIHHIPTAYIWHLPLCMVVCRWVTCGDGLKMRGGQFIFSLVVAVITGVQNPYNTNIFVLFLLIGAAVQVWRKWNWQAAIPALTLVGASAVAFLFMNSNTFLYHLRNGGNADAVVRSYQWMEFYSLKFVDMMMPPPDHRFPPFAAWATGHLNPADLRLSPGELPPTAYLGLVGIAALLWLACVSLRRVLDRSKPLPLEAWQVLWIMLYSDAGGINGFFGTLGFQLFRATTRYSILVLCLVLMYAARSLSKFDLKKYTWIYPVTLIVIFIALWDQVPPIPSQDEINQTAVDVKSDRDFTAAMENRLPAGGMVFEAPPMEFPEGPIPNVGSYEHFRPYLFSKPGGLKFSFGSDKGRSREKWQMELAQARSMGDFVSKLERYGFAGLYVNRKAFPDGGAGILRALSEIGYNDVIMSPKGDLFCVVLKPSPNPELPVAYGGLLN